MKAIDFFARRKHYIDHLAPVWNALPADRRGVFYTNRECYMYARYKLIGADINVADPADGENPILTCAYGDTNRATKTNRTLIMMEHGTGHSFGTVAYPDGKGGARDRVSFFLSPNEYTARKTRGVRNRPVRVIGTPKIDDLLKESKQNPNDGTVCISFHWGNQKTKPPEAGSALEWYKGVIPLLKDRYKLIGHGHPLARDEHKRMYEEMGIEYVESFDEVCRRATVYVNDLSSTLYEFTAIGRPIIFLNAPWFRRNINYGIRFWDYTDIGFHVEDPGNAIFLYLDLLLEHPDTLIETRRRAVRDLYPFLGTASEMAVNQIIDYLDCH